MALQACACGLHLPPAAPHPAPRAALSCVVMLVVRPSLLRHRSHQINLDSKSACLHTGLAPGNLRSADPLVWSELEDFEFKPVSGAWASPPEPQQGPVQGQTTSGALLRPAAGTDGPRGCRMPPTALTGTYGTARDMPLPMPHPRQPAPAGTAGAEWAVCCCCVRVVTTAVDHASTTDGTDALGIVGRVVIGWSGHERAARAAFCRQDDMNANEKAGSTTGWTTLLLDCGVSADTIRQTDDAEHWP